MRWALVVGGIVLWLTSAAAEMSCDGLDDAIATTLAASNFLTASTGTLMMWYKPVGVPTSETGDCYGGGAMLISDATGGYFGLNRNSNFGGVGDRLCAWHWDGNSDEVPVTYTVNTWVHLAWVHSGGTLCFYKDGALAGACVASGDTLSLTQGLSVCGGGGLAHPAQGVLAGVSLEPTALSASVIAAIAKSRLHRLHTTRPNGLWELNTCAVGSSGHGVTFADRSGNNRPLVGNHGAGAGLLCGGDSHLSYPWGVE